MIMGYAGRIAENESTSKTIQEQAEIVRKQSVRITELVQDLNFVSQLEYEMQPLHKEMVLLSKLLRTYVADLLNCLLYTSQKSAEKVFSNLFDELFQVNPALCHLSY